MILFTKTFIQISENEMAPSKLDGFLVVFSTPSKGMLESTLQGMILSVDDSLNTQSYTDCGHFLTKTFTLDEFKGKDILEELHNIYIEDLRTLNPNIQFNKNTE